MELTLDEVALRNGLGSQSTSLLYGAIKKRQPLRAGKMQLLQEPGVENAEHRGVGADAQRQQDNHERSKSRTTPQQ